MKKQLLFVACMLLVVMGFASRASALNAYAYGLSYKLSDDKSEMTINYSLNADAKRVAVSFFKGEEEKPILEKVFSEEANITAGAHTVTVSLSTLPKGVDLNWYVVAESDVVTVPTAATKAYQFYHPQGVAVDNNPMSPNFGRILVTESMNTSGAAYHSKDAADGKGVYAFDPQLNPIKNATGTFAFKGGQTFPQNFVDLTNTAYDPKKIKISEDGRIFLTRQNNSGSALYEINPNDLNAEFTEVFKGTTDAASYELRTAEGNFIAAPSVSLDLKGSGDNLKVLMLSGNKSAIQYVQSGFRTDEYNLGNATSWNAEPSKNIEALSKKWTISATNANVIYDNKGGIWYVQYRATPTETQPAILHINAEGVEDYRSLSVVAGGGGVCFNPDFTLLAMANKKGSVGIYCIGKDENNKPTLTLQYEFATTIGTNCNEIAWDSANNLYIVGNSGEWFKVFALPREDGIEATEGAGLINIPEEKKLYIIGQVDENEYKWGANVGYEMIETTTPGVYMTIVRIAESDAKNGTPAFGFATKLGSDANDWNTLNANRYGATIDGTMIVDKVESPLVKAEGAFKIKGGKYNVVADMNKMTIICTNLDPKPTTYALNEIVVMKEGLPAAGDARQSTLVNGKLYLQDHTGGKLNIWTTEGKSTKTLATGTGTNVCHDDAGNIIVRASGFSGSFKDGEKLIVHPINGGNPIEMEVTGIPAGRCDFFGNARGSVIDELNTGTLYLALAPVAGGDANKKLIAVTFKNGVQTDIQIYPFTDNSITDGSTIAYPYNDNVILHNRSGNIRLGSITADKKFDDSKSLVTPGRNAANGSSIFTMGGVDYILYSTQTNYRDGFAIAQVSIDADNTKLVEHVETLAANPNVIQANWLAAEVLSDNRALIYQYTPGAFIAVYEFTTATATEYPEKLYAIGSIYGDPTKDWNPADETQVLEPTKNEGEYLGRINIVKSEEDYGFFTIGATPSADWNIFNTNRFGPKLQNTILNDGEIEGAITRNGDTSYKLLGAKSYDVTINLKRGFAVAKLVSGVDGNSTVATAKVIAGTGEINVIGDAKSIEVFTIGGALISRNMTNIQCAAGIYIVKVDGNVTKVIVK